MKEFIEYALQFGSLNKQQIELVATKMTELKLQKDQYFSEAGKIPKQVAFVIEGVVRGCYYNNQGEEITRCFISENSLAVDYFHFEAGTTSSEYLQAATNCTHSLIKTDPLANFSAKKVIRKREKFLGK